MRWTVEENIQTGKGTVPATGVGLVLVVLGSLLATAAILSLGRSFGIEPARRGLQTRQLYRVVRRPILCCLSADRRRLSALLRLVVERARGVIWLAVQITRIQREEALLGQDAQYRRYAQHVWWRVLPGV